MKVEVFVQDRKQLCNKDIISEVANVLNDLSKRETFETESTSVKTPMWQIDNYGNNGLNMVIRMKKE